MVQYLGDSVRDGRILEKGDSIYDGLFLFGIVGVTNH